MTRGRLFRLAVAIGLTAYVLWRAAPSQVIGAAAGVDVKWVVEACALVVFDRALMAYRWWLLLCTIDPQHRPPLPVILRIFFVSTFVGTFLPSVGGDVYRAYSLARYGVRGAQAASSVLMDRLLGVVSILVMAAAGLVLATRLASNPAVITALVLGAVGSAAALGAVLSPQLASLGTRVVQAMPESRVRRIAGELIAAIRDFSRFRRTLLYVLVLSIGVQILRVVQAYCLGRGLHIGLPVSLYFAVLPTILLVMLLPVTISGLGTGQWAFVGLFGEFGVPAASAFALSVLFIALGIVGNLPGAALYVHEGRPGGRETDELPRARP